MIVGIVGDEATAVTVGDEKINQVVERLLERIIKKYPQASFITSDHPGVEKLTETQLKAKKYNHMVIHMYTIEAEYLQQNIELLVDLSDNVIIITNGQRHSRLDRIKRLSEGKCLVYNYLLDKEKMF